MWCTWLSMLWVNVGVLLEDFSCECIIVSGVFRLCVRFVSVLWQCVCCLCLFLMKLLMCLVRLVSFSGYWLLSELFLLCLIWFMLVVILCSGVRFQCSSSICSMISIMFSVDRQMISECWQVVFLFWNWFLVCVIVKVIGICLLFCDLNIMLQLQQYSWFMWVLIGLIKCVLFGGSFVRKLKLWLIVEDDF